MENKSNSKCCEESLNNATANLNLNNDCHQLQLHHMIGFNGELRCGLIVHALGQHIIYTVGFNIIIETVGGHGTGTQEILTGHSGTVSALAMSYDGRFLASGQESSQDSKSPIILWDWYSRKALLNIALHKTKIEFLTFSCMTKHFISLGGQDDGCVAVWSTALKKPVVSTLAQIDRAGVMHCLAASKIDEGVFATAGDLYGRIWTFDSNDKTLSYTEFKFGPCFRVVICMEIADLDNSKLPLIFCGTTSGDLLVVHGRTGVFQFVVPGKPMPLGITAISYVRMIDHNIFLFLLGTGEGKVGYYNIIHSVDNHKRVTGAIKPYEGRKYWKDERENSSVTSICELCYLAILCKHPASQLISAAKIGEGQSFFAGTKDSKIYRFNLEKWTADLIRTCSRTSIMALAFPRATDEILVTGEYCMVRVYNLKLLLEVRRYIRTNRTCKALVVNHDGTQIYTGWDDGTTVVLGFTAKNLSLNELYTIQCTQKQSVTALDLTSKSDLLVSGGDDAQCHVWRLVDDLDMRGKRLRQGLLLYHLISQSGPITKVQVSQSDEFFVSSSVDGSAVIYDLIKGLKRGVVKVDLGLTSVGYCSGDLHLITSGGDGKVYFWEIKTGECLRIVSGCPYGGVFCLDVDKKQTMFATSGEDRLVKLWDADEGVVTHIGQAHSDVVSKIKFGPCGTILVSGAKDGAVCIWNVPKLDCN